MTPENIALLNKGGAGVAGLGWKIVAGWKKGAGWLQAPPPPGYGQGTGEAGCTGVKNLRRQ